MAFAAFLIGWLAVCALCLWVNHQGRQTRYLRDYWDWSLYDMEEGGFAHPSIVTPACDKQ